VPPAVPAGSTSTCQTLVSEAVSPARVNSATLSASTGKDWARAVPGVAVSPPYMVTGSLLPSSWRWSCLRRRPPSGLRVTSQVRERSQLPSARWTWNGTAMRVSLHAVTAITIAAPARSASAASAVTIRPA
jgi:hypothetical protein